MNLSRLLPSQPDARCEQPHDAPGVWALSSRWLVDGVVQCLLGWTIKEIGSSPRSQIGARRQTSSRAPGRDIELFNLRGRSVGLLRFAAPAAVHRRAAACYEPSVKPLGPTAFDGGQRGRASQQAFAAVSLLAAWPALPATCGATAAAEKHVRRTSRRGFGALSSARRRIVRLLTRGYLAGRIDRE